MSGLMDTVAEPGATPQPGDVVELLADWYGSNRKGSRGVIDSTTYGPGTLMVTLRASAFRPEDGHLVRTSGGPCPCVKPEQLTYLGTANQQFWCWKSTPKAGGGVDYMHTVNL